MREIRGTIETPKVAMVSPPKGVIAEIVDLALTKKKTSSPKSQQQAHLWPQAHLLYSELPLHNQMLQSPISTLGDWMHRTAPTTLIRNSATWVCRAR